MTGEPGYRELLEGHLAGEALDRITHYAELVDRWSRRHNLVRFGSRRELVGRHLLDALAGARLLRGDGYLLDVGSGAGLPGVPLLAASPAWRGMLLEPRQKRWAFLKTVIRELGLDAVAVDCRFEELGETEPFDLVTSRAVGRHRELLEWARGRLATGGGVALWTTDQEEERIAEERGWRVLSWPLIGLDRGRLVYVRPT
jgi:16S rRNA (guanine527-N7)-methyltransferase